MAFPLHKCFYNSPMVSFMVLKAYGVSSQTLAEWPEGRAEGSQWMAWGQGWRKPVKSSVIQAGRCCGHYPLNPLAPLQLLSTKCSQTGVGGHLSKIWYAEPKGLALLSASETSLQRTLEYCLCSVLLIIYARQQRRCPPSDQLDEFLLWHEALSLSVLLPEVSVRFSSSWASEKGKIIERWSFLRTDYSAGHFTAYWMRDLEPVINCSDPQHLLWNGDITIAPTFQGYCENQIR